MSYFAVQVRENEDQKWSTHIRGNRSYCLGWFEGSKLNVPRLAMRVVKLSGVLDWKDGELEKVVDEIGESNSVSIGMIAGRPSPEQYERAGNEALKRAAEIRAIQEREAARRFKS